MAAGIDAVTQAPHRKIGEVLADLIQPTAQVLDLGRHRPSLAPHRAGINHRTHQPLGSARDQDYSHAVPASADVNGHLDRNYANLRSTFLEWTRLDAYDDRTDVIATYFDQVNIGDTERLGAASVRTTRARAGDEAPSVLMVGSHDTLALSPSDAIAPPGGSEELRGPGTGRLLGATMAFLEGFKATVMGGGTEPVNIQAISVGPGDTAGALIEAHVTEPVDVVVLTDSVCWSPELPTLTVGARGRIEASITLSARRPINDAAYAGATLNPLNRLVDMVAGLRNDKGRIVLDEFYTRAQRPERDALAPLAGTQWIEAIGGALPSGSLPPIDRATQWPVISVLDVHSKAATGSTPASATARLAFYLVPDQRPVDVERSLRAWVQDNTPETLTSALRIESSARPYRLQPDSAARAAHTRALKKVTGRQPLAVPAGGAIGAGEIHYATAAPVLFAGISGPHQRWGSVNEGLAPELLEQGVAVAAELCAQLPRRSSLRST